MPEDLPPDNEALGFAHGFLRTFAGAISGLEARRAFSSCFTSRTASSKCFSTGAGSAARAPANRSYSSSAFAAASSVADRNDQIEVEVLDLVGLPVEGSCCRSCNN
jgi:hypothetical protein